MAQQFVVGIFASKGIADDACHRLVHEGVPERHVSLLLLREVASLRPPVGGSALEVLTLDPLVVSDVHDSYAPYIHNGETAIFVNTHSEDEAKRAARLLKLYAPLRIRLVTPGEGAPLGRDIF